MTLADVIACRDDVMIYLMQKDISPKIAFDTMEDVRCGRKINPNYIKTLIDHGVPQWYIDSCNKITYLFPKAHATAYVIMS
jgi:DNA polymerase-3 subunit alpha (Gram-positive type)